MTIAVLFFCGCWHRITVRRWRKLGTALVCPIHGKPALRANEREWHASCRECGFGRWRGEDKAAADRAASAHSQERPAHHVTISYDEVPTHSQLRAPGRSHTIRKADRSSAPTDTPPF